MINYTDEQCHRICELTNEYLHSIIYRVCSDHIRTENILEHYKKPEIEYGSLSLLELYRHFLGHVQNTSTGGNAMKKVFGSRWGKPDHQHRWAKLEALLGGFDPKYVQSTFPTMDVLLNAINDTYQQNKFTVPAKRFIMSIFEIGHFLGKFPDGKSIYDYMYPYYQEKPTKLIEHLLSLRGIHKRALAGLGEGLLRDSLKEIGFTDFVKPDVHIRDIAVGLNITDNSASDSQIAETIAEVAKRGGITPYHLDKFFFLIGSGAVYRDLEIQKVLGKADSIARKRDFAIYVLEQLDFHEPQKGQQIALLVNYNDIGLKRGQVGEIISLQAHSLIRALFKNETGQAIEKDLYPNEFVVLHGKV